MKQVPEERRLGCTWRRPLRPDGHHSRNCRGAGLRCWVPPRRCGRSASAAGHTRSHRKAEIPHQKTPEKQRHSTKYDLAKNALVTLCAKEL